MEMQRSETKAKISEGTGDGDGDPSIAILFIVDDDGIRDAYPLLKIEDRSLKILKCDEG